MDMVRIEDLESNLSLYFFRYYHSDSPVFINQAIPQVVSINTTYNHAKMINLSLVYCLQIRRDQRINDLFKRNNGSQMTIRQIKRDNQEMYDLSKS